MADSSEVPLRPAGEQDVAAAKPAKPAKQPKQPKEQKQGKQGGDGQKQKQTPVPGSDKAGKKADANLNGITVSKDINFSEWYQEIVTKGELVEYYTEVRTTQQYLGWDRFWNNLLTTGGLLLL